MPTSRVLFIGGTGVISSACTARAVECGLDVTVLNRGATSVQPLPDGVEVLHADIRDSAALQAAVGARDFDVVVDFIAYTPEHVQADIDLFRNRTSQYVLVSTTSTYKMPLTRLPVTESTLQRAAWGYAHDKIACEELLAHAYRDEGFPVTIVRPSHTYDIPLIPLPVGQWTVVDRMRRGKPVVVHGDGTSVWVATHSREFASAFVGLLGNRQAIGEAFHITSDELLTWNHMYEEVASAAGVAANLVHVASERIAQAADPELADMLLGHLAHSVMYDNSKVRSVIPSSIVKVPFSQGARELVDWYDAHPEAQVVDKGLNALFDRLVQCAERPLPD